MTQKEVINMIYELYASLEATIGLDREVNLTLRVQLDSAPTWLSDFAGGSGEVYDGYSTMKREFKLNSAPDERRVELVFKDEDSAILSPEFVRHFNPADPFNQLQAVPLKNEQTLLLAHSGEMLAKKYKVTGSSWWR